ncbi:MAG: copper ion binding protein, partial [Pseudomonas sp.]|nr:copper ion binding protein [Pseudomonas sp.]
MTRPTLIDLPIRGMTCAGCAGRAERALQQVPGVSRASVNLLAERAQVQYQGDSPQALIDAITACGYQVPQEALELQISGMSCASCVGRVERALAHVPGVLTVSVNLASERAHLQLLGTADPQTLLAAVVAAGYQASLLNAEAPPSADANQPLQRERWSLLLAIGLALPLLLPMLVEPFGLHWMQPAWL